MSIPAVTSANLGPTVAAFTCRINGEPTAVVSTSIVHSPQLKSQALAALLCAGLDAGSILGALNGRVCSRPMAQNPSRTE